jgi:RimJ/RimL family protein N-acetyltransferase
MSFDYLALTENLEQIESDLLVFRPVSGADAWPLYLATRNPLFNSTLSWAQPADQAEVVARVAAIMRATRRGQMSAISAVIRETGALVSIFRFQAYKLDPSVLEMGIWTMDRYWNSKMSTEVTQACVDAAFRLSPAEALLGASEHHNRGARKVLTNCGLEPHSDVVRRAECGRIAHLTEFRITRAAWEARGCADSFTYVGDVAYEIAINLSGDHLSTGPSRVAAIPGVTPELEEVRLRA